MKIFKAFDIPVELHPTWVFFIAFISFLGTKSAASNPTEFAVGFFVFFAIFTYVFSFVVLHEFGHALTAKHFGYEVRKIGLYPFGGIAFVDGSFSSCPKHEFWITFFGPFVNVVLFLITGALMALTKSIAGENILFHILKIGFYSNLVMFLFNLLPIYPMDGGRIMRSLLVHKFGNAGLKYALWVSASVCAPVSVLAMMNGYWMAGIIMPIMLLQGFAETKTREMCAAVEDDLVKYVVGQMKTARDSGNFNSVGFTDQEAENLARHLVIITTKKLKFADGDKLLGALNSLKLLDKAWLKAIKIPAKEWNTKRDEFWFEDQQ